MNSARSSILPLRRGAVHVATMWAALLPAVVFADVYTYSIDRFVSYTQTSSSQPTTPETWSFLAFLGTGVENELLSAAVSFNAPPIVSYDLGLSSDPTHTYAYFSSAYYPDQASSLLVFPGTTYTFTIDRGAGPETADMFLAEDLYSLEVPYLTGGTFDSMQHLDASQPFNGTINGFTMAAGTNVGFTYLAVVEDGAPGSLWTAVLAPGETAFQIPAALLTPNTHYSIGISSIDLVLIENAGFGTASSQAGFTRGTGASFSTFAVPPLCPADFNSDTAVDFFDYDDFVTCFEGGACPPGKTADFNNDTAVDFFDYDDFVVAFETPC